MARSGSTQRLGGFVLGFALAAAACSSSGTQSHDLSDQASEVDTSFEADLLATEVDISQEDGDTIANPELSDAIDAKEAEADSTIAAEDYCEATVELFCGYYMRCSLMAVDSFSECQSVFLEVCNAVYEPRYLALEERGSLRVDPNGIAACAAHLDGVACEQQLFDLDGPCARVWRGLTPQGGECAPGVESFVCDEQTTCVLGMDFCGTCQPAGAMGDACADGRCASGAQCVSEICEPRALPGEACGPDWACVLGADCIDSVCVGFERVGVSAACDRDHRCPYSSACVDGVCVVSALLGEECGALQPCVSGRCLSGRCEAKLSAGEDCSTGTECLSGLCGSGQCLPLPGPCFTN